MLRGASKMVLEKPAEARARASNTEVGGWPPGCCAQNEGPQGRVKRARLQACLNRPSGCGVNMHLGPTNGTGARIRAEDSLCGTNK